MGMDRTAARGSSGGQRARRGRGLRTSTTTNERQGPPRPLRPPAMPPFQTRRGARGALRTHCRSCKFIVTGRRRLSPVRRRLLSKHSPERLNHLKTGAVIGTGRRRSEGRSWAPARSGAGCLPRPRRPARDGGRCVERCGNNYCVHEAEYPQRERPRPATQAMAAFGGVRGRRKGRQLPGTPLNCSVFVAGTGFEPVTSGL
jgi:hypothetical protein